MVDRLESRSRRSVTRWPIAVLRIYTGVFFAWHGLGKIRRGDFSLGMEGFLNGQADNSFAFYRTFVDAVVMPHSGLFAAVVSWGELLIGIGLILGLATRYAALAGALLVANFWFAKGQGFLDGTNHDTVWLVIFLVLALVPAGQIAGLDGRLADRLRFLR